MGYLGDSIRFMGELRRDFFHTGAVLPSSPFLARAMTAPLRAERGPANILEVGPGTGAVTSYVLGALRDGDHLDIVEINDHFVAHLRERFTKDQAFQGHKGTVALHHRPIQEVEGQGSYDYILSGLPMNNFPPGLVREIFRGFRRLLKAGGTLTYFEYVGIRQLKTPLVGRSERRRLGRVGRIVERYQTACEQRRDVILVNVPPAYVRHLRLDGYGRKASAQALAPAK